MDQQFIQNLDISLDVVLGIEDDLDDGNITQSEFYKEFIQYLPQDVFDNFLTWFGQEAIERYLRNH